jgi:hypothetical protein
MKYLRVISLLGVAMLSGCTTYKQQSQKMMAAWQAGDSAVAVVEVTARADAAQGSKDEILWRLEQGTVLSAAGDVSGGLLAFDQAEALVNRYEESAKVHVASEAVALLSNQAHLPYRGRAYDKVMMNTYKALNYLLLSESEKARIELNRALQRQRDAVAENQKKIDQAAASAEQSRQGALQSADGTASPAYDVSRTQQDAAFSSAVNQQLSEVDQRLLSYADYVNPFSVFVDGLFFSHMGLDQSDMERALKSFERVKGMSPGNYISEDYAMAEAMANGAAAEPVTYIIYSAGSAPTRSSIRIDIPLFLLTDEIAYVGASFPRLKFHDDYIPGFTARAGDGSIMTSERLCSMDAVVSRDFKNEWPAMMTKTLLTTATKALVGYAAEEAARKNGNEWAQLAAKVASAGYQAATNIADLRTWSTLPKEISYIRMPTPADGQLTVQVGGCAMPVTVTPGQTHFVKIRCVNNLSQPIVSQFTLNQEGK